MKRTILILIVATFSSVAAFAQSENKEMVQYVQKGQFSLGMRQTTSLFGHDNTPGLGVGGQMRWQFLDFLNTEWFADSHNRNR